MDPNEPQPREEAYYHTAEGNKYTVIELLESVLMAKGIKDFEAVAQRFLKEVAETEEGRDWILAQGYQPTQALINELSMIPESRSWLITKGITPTPLPAPEAGDVKSAF